MVYFCSFFCKVSYILNSVIDNYRFIVYHTFLHCPAYYMATGDLSLNSFI